MRFHRKSCIVVHNETTTYLLIFWIFCCMLACQYEWHAHGCVWCVSACCVGGWEGHWIWNCCCPSISDSNSYWVNCSLKSSSFSLKVPVLLASSCCIQPRMVFRRLFPTVSSLTFSSKLFHHLNGRSVSVTPYITVRLRYTSRYSATPHCISQWHCIR